MKNKLAILSIFVLFAMPFAFAMDEPTLPDPGVTPDSPIWGLDRAIENIQLALTFDPEKKVEKILDIADERLAEEKAMIEENKQDDAAKAETAREDELDTAQSEANQPGMSDAIRQKVLDNLQKHITVLQGIQAKLIAKGVNNTGIVNALNKSSQVIVKFQTMNVTAKAKGGY